MYGRNECLMPTRSILSLLVPKRSHPLRVQSSLTKASCHGIDLFRRISPSSRQFTMRRSAKGRRLLTFALIPPGWHLWTMLL